MAGTMSNAKVQLRNAESSVLFLQQEHAKTLEGLYAEISKLQKKCGELTFQMAMNSTCIAPDEEKLREKCLRTEKEFEKKNHEVMELEKLLESKTKHNSLLERNMRTVEESVEETMRNKDRKISSLTAELDVKAGNIVYLTKQLHDSKVAYTKLSKRLSNLNPNGFERDMLSPAPPEDKAPGVNRRRFVRKVAGPTNGPMDVNVLKNGLNPTTQKMFLNMKTAKSSDGFPSRSARSKTPTQKNPRNARSMGDPKMITNQSQAIPDDYMEFLKTGAKPETKVVYKPPPNPLPPILNGVENNGTAYKVHRSRGHDPGVVDEIIVSPLNSPDKSWRQGSNQYDPVS